MRVVLDCNVLVSAARTGGACGAVAQPPAHAPYRDTLLAIVEELKQVAAFELRDPKDEIYLATAQEGGAILATGNIRDFTELRYGSVEVYSPRGFLDRTA